MAQYDRAIATAKKLIKKYGALCVVTAQVITEKAGKDWEEDKTETFKYEGCRAAFFDYKRKLGTKDNDDKNVVLSEKLVYLSMENLPVTEELPLLMTIQKNGESRIYSVSEVDLLAPGNQNVLYTLKATIYV